MFFIFLIKSLPWTCDTVLSENVSVMLSSENFHRQIHLCSDNFYFVTHKWKHHYYYYFGKFMLGKLPTSPNRVCEIKMFGFNSELNLEVSGSR